MPTSKGGGGEGKGREGGEGKGGRGREAGKGSHTLFDTFRRLWPQRSLLSSVVETCPHDRKKIHAEVSLLLLLSAWTAELHRRTQLEDSGGKKTTTGSSRLVQINITARLLQPALLQRLRKT